MTADHDNVFITQKKFIQKSQKKREFFDKEKKRENLYCELHGNGNHDTFHCFTIKKLRSLGYEKKSIKLICEENEKIRKSEESDEQNNFFNKNNNSYIEIPHIKIRSNRHLLDIKSSNPFYIKIYLFNQIISAIVDTGADISLINVAFLPKNFSGIHANRTKIISASGNIRLS
ncbi:hypothetical protein COBT_004125 [Conglomerata obtusa]